VRALVVLPTYQEAGNIRAALTRLRESVPDADILVVDDNSPDGTADLAEELGRECGHIEVLRRPGKDGLGSAYRAGFTHGLERGYEVLVEIDADGSHDPAVLPDLLAAVENGADLAIGSRYVPGGSTPEWPATRRAISVIGNRYAGFVLGLDVRDATAGYRAYNADVLRKLDLPAIRADGYGFQVEMAYRVSRLHGRIVELPIVFKDRVEGDSKMSLRIVAEALVLVTAWAVRDRLVGIGRRARQVSAT
jgi:dolichol-phosphate mannosyltransferase